MDVVVGSRACRCIGWVYSGGAACRLLLLKCSCRSRCMDWCSSFVYAVVGAVVVAAASTAAAKSTSLKSVKC